MPTNNRLLHALSQEDAEPGLRQVVQELAAEGHSKEDVHGCLMSLLLAQREAHGVGRAEEDAILDTMDAVQGWVHPGARLFPEEKVS